MAFEQKYSDDARRGAVAAAIARRDADPGDRSIIRTVAQEFEVGEQSLRLWIKQHDNTAPRRRPVLDAETTERLATLEEERDALRARVEALTEENSILKKAFKIITAG